MNVAVGSIILLAFFCESLFGFGGGLISIPLISLLLPVKDAVIFVLIFQLLIGVLVFGIYKDIDWKSLRYMFFGVLLGSVLGTVSLKIVSDVFLRQILAISIILFLIKSLIFPTAQFKKGVKSLGFLSGLLGAYIQGMVGAGGPIFTMYLLSVIPERNKFRATIIALFFITSVIRMTTTVSSGLLTPAIMQLALPFILPFIIVVFIGQKMHLKISDIYYRYAVYIILFGSSLSLLFKK
jgi:uncharacterized membrane protein YfcA